MKSRRRIADSAKRPRNWSPRRSMVVPAVSGQPNPIDELIARGDAAMTKGDSDTAARAYASALGGVADDASELQVAVYLRLGHANQARGRTLACMHCYRRALETDPHHGDTLRALVELHAEWHEWSAVEAAEERLYPTIADRGRLLTELLRSGDRWWKVARDPRVAKRRYRQALETEPTSERVAARLRAITSSGQSPGLSELRRIAMAATGAKARARAYFELGSACWHRADDMERAIAALEEAIRCDPMLLSALQVLVHLLIECQQWRRLEQLCNRLAGSDDSKVVAARATIREALRATPGEPPQSQRIKRRTLRLLDRQRLEVG